MGQVEDLDELLAHGQVSCPKPPTGGQIHQIIVQASKEAEAYCYPIYLEAIEFCNYVYDVKAARTVCYEEAAQAYADCLVSFDEIGGPLDAPQLADLVRNEERRQTAFFQSNGYAGTVSSPPTPNACIYGVDSLPIVGPILGPTDRVRRDRG